MGQSFSGKLNILSSDNGQFMASIFLTQGSVVGGHYRNLSGSDAVILACYHGMPGQDGGWGEIKFMPEPEIISSAHQQVKWDYNALQVELHRYILQWTKLKQAMPKDQLFLLAQMPSPSSLITHEQFKLLSLLTQVNLVHEVFLRSPFLPTQTLEVLISMRKLGWIRVASAV